MAEELTQETFYWTVHRRDKYGASANYLQDFVSLQSIECRVKKEKGNQSADRKFAVEKCLEADLSLKGRKEGVVSQGIYFERSIKRKLFGCWEHFLLKKSVSCLTKMKIGRELLIIGQTKTVKGGGNYGV